MINTLSSTDALGEERGTFMARIRAALGTTTTTPPGEAPPQVDESLARLASVEDDLPELFARQAEAVGMTVHRVDHSVAVSAMVHLMREKAVKRVGVAAGAAGRELDLERKLEEAEIEVVNCQGEEGADSGGGPGLDPQYELDAGITDVHAALAESGTLINAGDASHSRGLSLVPPIHLALVRSQDILPDLIDYYARLKGMPGTELPSSIAMTTGPSKTADIEGQMITGVHGPGEVHIFLITEPAQPDSHTA